MNTQAQDLPPIKKFELQFVHESNQDTLKNYLGKDVPLDRFTAVVIRAVSENADLLAADRKSLFYACQKAAQDGLMPDGKEGFLGIYNTNEGTKAAPNWVKKVQWQPMIGGLRKILANHGITIRAEIVYKNDMFVYDQGDEPRITHNPNVFGDRGTIVGAYAIATDKAGSKYRETMDLAELEKVRQASKQPNSGVWQTWCTEMYRKAVAKRLFKQLPLVDTVAAIIERDNEQFDMNKRPEPSQTAQDVQAAVRLAAPDPTVRLDPVGAQEPIYEVVTHQEEGWPEEENVEFGGPESDF